MQIQLLPKMQLYIGLEKASRKALQGLCGNFNTKEGDDFTTSGGLVEATASAFANTWKALATCHDISDWLDDPCSVSIENKNYADFWCSKLENNDSPFAKCHSTIDPTEYTKRCRYDSCNCKDSEHCMCAALSSYVRACAAKGIILLGWKNGICDKDITSCPSSQIYLYNLTTCQPTCRSLAEGDKACAAVFTPVDGCGCPDGQYMNEKDQCVHKSKCSCYHHDTYLKPQEMINTKDKHCICQYGKLVCNDQVNKTCPGGKVYYDCNKTRSQISGASIRRSCKTLSVEYFRTECISGCVCPNGLLDDGAGACVPEDKCPCVHNEDIYPHGSQVKVDCNTCLCQRGRWTCTNTVCHGTCAIYGNGHFITFDNKIYDFDGNCEFVAAQDYCETDSSGGSFIVLTENIPCGTTGVTCSKSVKVILGNTILKLSEKHIVKTVGEGGKHMNFLTREVGIYLVIEASNGILLIWDKKTTIFIKVSPAYKGKLCGLCGNFDDNSQNDFKTRHNIQVIDVLEFGNSWKVDATCPDATDVVNPCSQNPHRHSWAEKQCGIIKSQVFKICHSKVDPKPFYEACVNDACSCDSGGDCECFCTAVAAYAQECTKAEACVYWRTPDICPIFCDYYNPEGECEWHYHPCGNHSVQTCRSINKVYSNVTITYLEGCYPTCPKNKPIFDEAKKKCVTMEECGCYIDDVHYESGAEVPHHKKCHKCVCSSNENIDCEKLDVSSCSSTTPITTRSITPATISPTASTEACASEKVCLWTQWLDVSKPGEDVDSGDYETYEEIRKHHAFCEVPERIQCRAANAPNVSLDDLKQVVHCNVSYGLICRNSEQRPDDNHWQKCFNYEVRMECCHWICPEITLLTTTPILIETNATILQTTARTLDTTTGSSSLLSTTSELTTPVQICTPVCSWSEWFSVSYPETGGDYETYQNIRQAGYDVCEKPLHISCRARRWPNKALHELLQKVTCDVSYGLICNNEEQDPVPRCFDYEIRVYCCRVPDKCLYTTPQISERTSSPPVIIPTISAGTNTTTTWTPTKTFRETSSRTKSSTPMENNSTSTHKTSFTTTIHITETRAKTTAATSSSSTSKAEMAYKGPESTLASTTEAAVITNIPSPTTTPITILSTPFPTKTSYIPPTTSTTSPPVTSSASTATKQMIATEGRLTGTIAWTPKMTSIYTSSESVFTAGTTSSTTSPITSVTRIVLTTNTTSLSTEANKAASSAPKPTTKIEVTSAESLTSSTTSTHMPTKSMPVTTAATATAKSNGLTGTTTTTSVASTLATSTISTISTPSESMQTLPTQRATATSNVSPTITTATSKMSEFITAATIDSATTTSLEITTLSVTSQLKTRMPKTSSTGQTLSEAAPTTSSEITSVKETSISSSTMCVCVHNGTTYPPGEIISKATNETWCQKVICSTECKIEVNNWLCPTSTPARTSMPASKSTSETSPSITSTSPLVTSAVYSTAHRNSSPKKTTSMVSSKTEKRGCSFERFREPNETWMLNNCTMAKCLDNRTVEIIEVKCEPPPVITCANGYPPIPVVDDNQCCWHWECDCVCSGWGDPHYKTFDGTYYTFQGNCTYTLVEEIEKKNNFAIYIDNYNCGTDDLVSCPRDIIVLHNSQEFQLVVAGLENTDIQVVVNDEIVGTPYKKYGVKIYTLGIYYVMEIPELGANITYNGLTFYIKLPYDRFGHNTQGQCGTCTNNQSDDCRTRDGKIVSSCEIMADSWIIEDAKKPECGRIKTKVPPEVTSLPSPTCQPSRLCSLIMGPTFQKCHKILSPNDYHEACVYDSCHVSRSKIECSSLQHYAQLCRDKGICIDWRSQVPECSMPCPSHKVYNACGSAIPRTCETTSEGYFIMKDGDRLVEGCFCPQGTVRFSPAVDVCVDTCGCMGPDNVPRKFGEKFQFGCQDCTCIEGGSGITCQEHKCKEMTRVQCNLEGFYPEVQISPTDRCCKETVCKCDRRRCETISPTCDLGYEAVGSIQEGHCCFQYKCAPKNVCVHGNAEYLPGAPVYTDNCQTCVCAQNSSTGLKIRCTDIPYNVRCPSGFAVKKSARHCCGECEQTHCVLSLNDSISSYHLIKPGEVIISENNCTLYGCTEVRNQFITSMSQISCPHFDEDDCEPGTIEFSHNGCCKVCVKKMTSCKLYEYYDYLSYNNCRTADSVKLSRCDGSCGTFSIYSSAAKAMSHKCACCQEVQTSQKHVMLQCSDGSQEEHEYIAVEKCDCIYTECEPWKLDEEMTSAPAKSSIKVLSQDNNLH